MGCTKTEFTRTIYVSYYERCLVLKNEWRLELFTKWVLRETNRFYVDKSEGSKKCYRSIHQILEFSLNLALCFYFYLHHSQPYLKSWRIFATHCTSLLSPSYVQNCKHWTNVLNFAILSFVRVSFKYWCWISLFCILLCSVRAADVGTYCYVIHVFLHSVWFTVAFGCMSYCCTTGSKIFWLSRYSSTVLPVDMSDDNSTSFLGILTVSISNLLKCTCTLTIQCLTPSISDDFSHRVNETMACGRRIRLSLSILLTI